MTEKQFAQATEISKEIDNLKQHKADLEKARFYESKGSGLTFRFNDHHPEVRLNREFVSSMFASTYDKLIDEKIESLKIEFDNL